MGQDTSSQGTMGIEPGSTRQASVRECRALYRVDWKMLWSPRGSTGDHSQRTHGSYCEPIHRPAIEPGQAGTIGRIGQAYAARRGQQQTGDARRRIIWRLVGPLVAHWWPHPKVIGIGPPIRWYHLAGGYWRGGGGISPICIHLSTVCTHLSTLYTLFLQFQSQNNPKP